MRPRTGVTLGLVLLLLTAGCQPACRYPVSGKATPTTPTPPVEPPTVAEPPPLDIRLVWEAPLWNPDVRPPFDIPIVFVAQSKNTERWAELASFWNASPLADPRGVSSLFRSPLEVATSLALTGPTRVEIKVPLGLDDPTPHIPPENPPTLAAWQLGRRLFYDTSYLLPNRKMLSCASCHDPGNFFASKRPVDPPQTVNTPSLLNVVYRSQLYCDGRGSSLEQCLQRQPEDERTASGPGAVHVWPGAIQRLREHPRLAEHFFFVYGVAPNQEVTGRALATFLRTLLAGNSLHDRATLSAKQAGKAEPEAEQFVPLLTKETLVALKRPEGRQSDVAQELHRGYLLFHDKVQPTPTACVQCHSGSLFSNQGYHNLSLYESNSPGLGAGRFAGLPLGKRTINTMGAFRTASLRDVARTAPYFHTGHIPDLAGAVNVHLSPRWSSFLDPLFRVPEKPHQELKRPLLEPDREALLLYLRALNSEELPGYLLNSPW